MPRPQRFPGEYRIVSEGVDAELFKPGKKRQLVVLEWRPIERPLARAVQRALRELTDWELVYLRTKKLAGRPAVPAKLRGTGARAHGPGREEQGADPGRGRDLRAGARRPVARLARGGRGRSGDRLSAGRAGAARAGRGGAGPVRRERAAPHAALRGSEARSRGQDVRRRRRRARGVYTSASARRRRTSQQTVPSRTSLLRTGTGSWPTSTCTRRGRPTARSRSKTCSTTRRARASARSRSPTTTSSAARSRPWSSPAGAT